MKLAVLIIFFGTILCTASRIEAQINKQDSLALVDLYDSCGGVHWTNHDNWLTKAPVSTWYGIFYVSNGYTTGIDLQGNNLRGIIPASVGNMPGVTTAFIVSDNHIKEPLPKSLQNLTAPYDFEIDNNDLNFNGIQALTPIFNNQNHNYTYSPQANIALEYKNNEFSVTAGGTLANDTFRWYKNGILVIKKVGNNKYATTDAGSYYVTVTNKIATALTLVSNTHTLSASETNKSVIASTKLLLYPNPATDQVTLSLYAPQNEKAQVRIIDANGKVVLNQTLNLSQGTTPQTINVAKLAKGYYFINTLTEEGNTTERFIKE